MAGVKADSLRVMVSMIMAALKPAPFEGVWSSDLRWEAPSGASRLQSRGAPDGRVELELRAKPPIHAAFEGRDVDVDTVVVG